MEDRMEFPKEWDMSNSDALYMYNRCRKYYTIGEESKFVSVFTLSVFPRIICGFVVYYNIVSFVIIIFKKNTYTKMNSSYLLSLLFSLGSLLNTFLFYFRRLKYFEFPCFLVPYISVIGMPLSIFSSAGMILMYLKQCYTNASLFNKHYNEDVYKNYNRGFLHKISLIFTERIIFKLTVFYITISIFYVNILSTFEINYKINPLSKGFCVIDFEQGPGFILLTLFLLIFLPMAIYDIHMFRGCFSFGRTLLISLILNIICIILYLTTIIIPKYSCTIIVKYIPSEVYILLFFFVFHVTHITVPLIESHKINKHIVGLELNKKGLYRVFENEVLYKNFFEYAVKKRSVEYALFHVEYLEFKELFKNNNTRVMDDSIPSIASPIGSSNIALNKDKKFVQQYELIYNKATDIYNKYFKENSELELNLPGKLVRTVTNKFYDYTIYYNRYVVNSSDDHEIDFEKLNCETLFDAVHEEAIDSLFLNVYSSFAKEQKKIIQENLDRKRSLSLSIPKLRVSSYIDISK